MINDPKIISLAILGGLVPSLLWLWFWLKEDNQRPEPKGLLATIFVLGALAVFLVIPIERIIQSAIFSPYLQTFGWASVEEIIKFLIVALLLYKSGKIDEPVDWPIFLITGALGFAALENALFLAKPLALDNTTISLLTGELRFLGSTLLHAVSSAIIGVFLGLSFFMDNLTKKIYFLIGISLAIALHSAFNFFIINGDGNSLFKIMGFLWVVTIIVMLVFEKLRRMSI